MKHNSTDVDCSTVRIDCSQMHEPHPCCPVSSDEKEISSKVLLIFCVFQSTFEYLLTDDIFINFSEVDCLQIDCLKLTHYHPCCPPQRKQEPTCGKSGLDMTNPVKLYLTILWFVPYRFTETRSQVANIWWHPCVQR